MSGTTAAVEERTGGWDLSELLPDAEPATVDARLRRIEELVEGLEARRSRLGPKMERTEHAAIWEDFRRLVEEMYSLGAYGSLWFAEDTQSKDALAYRNRIEQALTRLHNRVLFVELWWKSLDDEAVDRLLPAADEDPDLRHYLLDLRRLEPFTLEERSEQIINSKDANGIGALLTLYSMLTNRLEFELEVDDEVQTLTRDQLTGYVYSTRPELRAAAYDELLKVAARESTILTQIYVNRIRDWHSEQVELRGHSSPIAVRNAANDIPDQAVEVLLDVAAANAGLFQRYFRLKAGWLGMERLRRYDIYAPLAASDRQVPWGDAVELVRETFAAFDPTFEERARRVFDHGHLDSEVRKGKKGGAFCATILPHQTPWVLLNYTGKVRDVATLAHELGHAVHSMLAEDHSVLVQHPSLPLAETASVFSEMLLTDRLLAEEDDPLVRRELLASAVDDIYATVERQAYFVRFEIAAHQAILEGCSEDELHTLYLSGLEEQFGDSLELPRNFRYEWVTIPHIYQTPFYCYAYSFGQLLVLALYRRYREQGREFVPGYLEMLAHGGSARPERILAGVSVDISDPVFWQGGFDVIADMVDELESL